MIAASEPQEFVPFGREEVKRHPGSVCITTAAHRHGAQSESFLAHRFSQVNIDDTSEEERWSLRDQDGVEEELYVCGKTAVISRGVVGVSVGDRGSRILHTSYCVESNISHALYTWFTLSNQQAPVSCLCIVDSMKISVFTDDGQDFLSPLQFKVASAWKTRFGLLLERVSWGRDGSSPSWDSLATLFSLVHPLDEISPVLAVKQGGMLSYMNDPCLKVVFTSDDPSICVLYDIRLGQHSVWKIRKALPQECQVMCGSDESSGSCGSKHATTSMAGFSLHQESDFRRLSNRSTFISGLSSSINSPHVSRGSSHAASPHHVNSPMAHSKVGSPGSVEVRLGAWEGAMLGEPKPIVPALCLDHAWTGAQGVARATKAFLSVDSLSLRHLCLLTPPTLCCVKLTETNDASSPGIILGAVSQIPAIDAVPVIGAGMTVVLESNGGVVVYTGTTLVGKLHLGGVLAELASSSYLSSVSSKTTFNASFPRPKTSLPFDNKRRSLLCSTPVVEGIFDEKVHLISPVSRIEPPSHNHNDSILKLRDPVADKFTIEFNDGKMFRFTLPQMSSSALVSECLRSLRQVLPRDVALQLVVKWYTARNAPGTQDITAQHEWSLFLTSILELLGYHLESLPLMENYVNALDAETPAKTQKKRRASDLGSQEDWDYLVGSSYHEREGSAASNSLCIELEASTRGGVPSFAAAREMSQRLHSPRFDTSAPLFPHTYLILFALHLLYEEMKLRVLVSDGLPMLVRLLHQLSTDLCLQHYTHFYWRDFPDECPINAAAVSQLGDGDLDKLTMPSFMTEIPPSAYEHIWNLLKETESPDLYPHIPGVNINSKYILQIIAILMKGDHRNEIKDVLPAGSRSDSTEGKSGLLLNPSDDCQELPNYHKALLFMNTIGMRREDIKAMPAAVALIIGEGLESAGEDPGVGWPESAYRLAGRLDMVPNARSPAQGHPTRPVLEVKPHPDTTLRTEQVLKLRFGKDERVMEVRRLVDSSEPVTINIQQRPEVSDHEFIEEQERHLYALCTRTMALPVARGMVELHTAVPVVSEPLSIPRLCLSGRAPPRGTTVELSHIEVVPNMNLWPLFHNGVAAGLRISPSADNIGSTWISYNKPKNGSDALPEHAGFLMALGLSGHLNNFDHLNLYEYLTRCHEMTSVGLLLGLAASKRGTMDVRCTKLLSVHIESLLPPTSIELDLVQNVQVTALLGIGLLYQGTAHRHIAEVLLAEIGRPPGPEMDNSCDRECYALAAGLGLGLVVLGRGANPSGLDDLAIADTLHYYMVGGHKRPLTGSQKEKYKSPSYQIREGDCVNNNVTAPGATLALGMMYFNTGNLAVANWLEVPDSEYMLDFVCPDLLLLRTVARGLILWDRVLPTKAWVESHVPPTVRPYCLVKPRHDTHDSIDYETMNQAYCNIIAGACMAMGLRFAASSNNEAFTTLLHYCKMFTSLSGKSIAELAGKSTIETTINVILLSLALVMAGTGELEVIRLVRYLRSRVGQTSSVVTYGSHLATHMALGLVLLGGGKYSLSTSPESIAALLCALFPRFPTHSNDNRYHLQALRHLYVLAVEPRLLLPRDIDTGDLCYAHLTLVFLDTPHYKDQSVEVYAPCPLPELRLLKEVRVEDSRYWPVVFTRDKNWKQLELMLANQECVGVKQRAGCLPYCDDPHGFRTLLAQTLSSRGSATSWAIPMNCSELSSEMVNVQSDIIMKHLKGRSKVAVVTNERSNGNPSALLTALISDIFIITECIGGFTSDGVVLNLSKHLLEVTEQNRVSTERELKLVQALAKFSYECVTRDKLPLLSTWFVILELVSRGCYKPTSQVMWELRLVLAYAGSKIWRHLGAELAVALNRSIDAALHPHSDMDELLACYLRSQDILASGSDLSRLSAYLTFYAIPLQPVISPLLLQGGESLLDLMKLLKPLKIPAPTIRKIWNISKLRP